MSTKDTPQKSTRSSRIAEVQAKIVPIMKRSKKGVSVAQLAEKAECNERDVRLAIDRARRGTKMSDPLPIQRLEKGVFGFAGKPSAPPAKTA